METSELLKVDENGSSIKSRAPIGFCGEVKAWPLNVAPGGFLVCDGSAISRETYFDLFETISPYKDVVTITIASPGVVSLTAHGLVTGDPVYFNTSGALPTGLAANTIYYAVYVSADTFSLATTFANANAGTKINTSGSQSGVHSLRYCPFGLGDGSTTFNLPNFKGKVLVGLNSADAEFDAIGPGTGVGEKTHVLTVAELAVHNHVQYLSQAAAGGGGAEFNIKATAVDVTNSPNNSYFGVSGSRGSGTAHNNIMPYNVINWIIKT